MLAIVNSNLKISCLIACLYVSIESFGNFENYSKTFKKTEAWRLGTRAGKSQDAILLSVSLGLEGGS